MFGHRNLWPVSSVEKRPKGQQPENKRNEILLVDPRFVEKGRSEVLANPGPSLVPSVPFTAGKVREFSRAN